MERRVFENFTFLCEVLNNLGQETLNEPNDVRSEGYNRDLKLTVLCLSVADPPTVCVTVGRTEALLLIIELGARLPVQIVDIGGLLRSK